MSVWTVGSMRLVTDSGTSDDGSRKSGIDQCYDVGAFNAKPQTLLLLPLCVHVRQMHDDR